MLLAKVWGKKDIPVFVLNATVFIERCFQATGLLLSHL
ncbi:hypothetical protein NSP_26870 [Nodularia spumigena CCY9414]|nr:hypothetical protein NSP_26870 [Nodularia spumigena CCY9414]